MIGELGGRRSHLRFEVTGELWASLDVRAEVTLRDISTGGALVEAPVGRLWAALRTMTIRLPADLNVIGVVRHVTAISSDPRHQLIGLEFVHVSREALAGLEQLVSQSTA